MRQDFRQISDVMIAYISVHKEHLKDLPRKAYCPMADADWIQTDNVLANPYFGASMLRCGTFKEWNRNDG